MLTSVLLDTITNPASPDTVRTRHWLPAFSLSFKFKMDSIPGQPFSSVRRLSGTYPEARLTVPPYTNPTANAALWAYRGNDYKIIWQTKTQGPGSGKLTCRVFDQATGDEVLFRRMNLISPAAPESAAGWCLYDSSASARPARSRCPPTPSRRLPPGS